MKRIYYNTIVMQVTRSLLEKFKMREFKNTVNGLEMKMHKT